MWNFGTTVVPSQKWSIWIYVKSQLMWAPRIILECKHTVLTERANHNDPPVAPHPSSLLPPAPGTVHGPGLANQCCGAGPFFGLLRALKIPPAPTLRSNLVFRYFASVAWFRAVKVEFNNNKDGCSRKSPAPGRSGFITLLCIKTIFLFALLNHN